jgi:hypothetical protein
MLILRWKGHTERRGGTTQVASVTGLPHDPNVICICFLQPTALPSYGSSEAILDWREQG